MISFIFTQNPSFSLAFSGLSNVDKISAPKDLLNLSTPSKSACSITVTPFSTNNYSG